MKLRMKPHATDFLRVDKRMLLTELFRAFDDLVSGKFTPCVDMRAENSWPNPVAPLGCMM